MPQRSSPIPCLIEILEPRQLLSYALYQAEADGSGDAGNQYAAVAFTTSTTLVSGGITYHALAGIQGTGANSTLSGHAQGVWGSFRNYANNQISDVWADSAGNLWQRAVYASSATGGSDGAPLLRAPILPDPAIRFVNNSWIGAAFVYNYGGTYSKTDLMARGLDFWVARDDLLMTSGAVGGGAGGSFMAWIGRNQLAVRGSQGFNIAGQTIRLHADLFGPSDGASSNTTPEVGGMAAKIMGAAQAVGNADGQHHEVAKSILMSGTDKGAWSGSFTNWNRELGNSFDFDSGAGRTIPARADNIVAGGQKALTALASLAPGSAIASPILTAAASGWSYINSIAESSSVALMFSSATAFSDITATLAWDVVPKMIGAAIDGGAENFANLNLRLFSVNQSGGVYTLGNALSGTGLSSITTNDNVEHIYYNGALLPAGSYAFVLEYADTPNLDGFTPDAGFSYMLNAPTAPSPAAVANYSASELRATWTDMSATETGFRIDIATNSSFNSGLRQFTAAANATSYLIPNCTPGTTYYVRVSALNSPISSQPSNAVSIVMDAPPTITSYQINSVLHAQRSMVNSLIVSFSEPVTLTSAFSLTRIARPLVNTLLGVSSTDQITYTITFTGTDIIGGSLADGRYSLAVSAAGVKDSANQSPIASSTFAFHRLFGDFDGDRDVDLVDQGLFKNALNRPANYAWYFDFNASSTVDSTDLLQLKSRMNRRVLS